MGPPVLAVAVVAATGVVTALGTGPTLRWLPEPADPEGKRLYRDLATVRFVLVCVALAMLAQALAWAALPPAVQPLWFVLAVCGVLLTAVDASTTWLPLSLTRATWLLMILASGLSAALGAALGDVLRTVAGALVAGACYLTVWLITRGGIGFGDVRFAPLLGAASASCSWTLLIWALLLGTLVGGVHGTLRLLRRRSGAFPYAPSMLAGAYLAVVLELLRLD